jgi:hypothetical protein
MPMTPPYLIPVHQLATGVRVRTTPDAPRERDGVPQSNRFFPGCLAWPVEATIVLDEHTYADGSVEKEVRGIRITVWASARPEIESGDVVTFQGLMAGAVEGTVFLQATGVARVEEGTDEIL